jgi:phosphate-selective porin OprO/OprP
MSMNTPLASRSFRLKPIGVALAVLLSLQTPFALAEEEAAEPAAPKRDKMLELLEKLKAKGVISDEEYAEIAGDSSEDRARARAERRKKALEAANQASKDEAARERFNGRFNNGIAFETPDRRNSFTLGGRIHADYRYFPDKDAASTFDVRRAYLTLQGKWNEYLTWDLTGDFANLVNNSQLDVAWMNIAYSDQTQFRLGQFKMPFSLEELGSSRFLDFQERSLVNGLVPQKERGLMVHGVPGVGMTYGLAVSTGQGKNNNDIVAPRASNDYIGRFTLNVAELLGSQAKATYHLGLAGSLGHLPSGFGLSQRTEARGINFFNTSSFSGSDVRRVRLGVEAAVAYGPVKLQGEWVQSTFEGRSVGGVEFDRQIGAYYAEILWMLTGERYAETYRNGVFGRTVPIQNYVPGGENWGAWELGLRYSSYDASDFVAGNAAGTGVVAAPGSPTANVAFASTPTNKATAITAGLKWIWNPNFKIYLNYTETRFDSRITVNPFYGGLPSFTLDKEKALTMRAAYDF